jgi:spore maturation protein CgeB
MRNRNRPCILLLYPTVGGGSIRSCENLEDALREEGFPLKVIDPWKYRILLRKRFQDKGEDEINNLTKKLTNNYLMEAIQNFRPDLFLTVFGLYIPDDVFSLLKEKGVRSCCWWLDDPWGFEHSSKIAPKFDLFFVHEPTMIKKYRAKGLDNVHYLPEACNPRIHKKMELTEEEMERYRCDLSFVGRPYPNRIEFLEAFTHWDLGIWGEGWNEVSGKLKRHIKGGEIHQSEMVKIFNASKIVLNLHPDFGMREKGEGISPRTFAIAGCGVFQLVDYRREMERLFKVGEEIIAFRNLDQAIRLVEYYLSHPEESELIAKRAQERVYREHTYKDRIREVLAR